MSRELDAEVAERVMGWWSVGIDTSNMLRSEIWADGKRKIYGFNPSEDISAAFDVVEKMREKFRRVEVHGIGQKHDTERAWVCMIEGGEDAVTEHYIAEAVAETAPLAICRAALLAIGETK